MEELALQATSLSKTFGQTRAVDGISLTMKKGEILGLLGPNGSGKSTTMKMILGILRPDAGSISVYGIDVAKDPMGVKKIVGYVPETPQTYEFLTGVEYLDFIADMYGISNEERKERIGQFLEGLQLKGHENDLIGGYSQGMKQKIAIISALLHRPKILVMDEALNGLDPALCQAGEGPPRGTWPPRGSRSSSARTSSRSPRRSATRSRSCTRARSWRTATWRT